MRFIQQAYIALVLLCCVLSACAPQSKPETFNTESSRLVPEHDLNERLAYQKKLWDDLYIDKTLYRLYSTSILVNPLDLTLMSDSIKSVYTFYSDSMGNIKKVMVAPYDIDRHSLDNSTHYFDNEGQTFAFENHAEDFFGSTTIIATYNKSFEMVTLEKITYDVATDSTSQVKNYNLKDFHFKVAPDFESYQKLEDFQLKKSR
ncbi:MAG: hypothetical protein V4613_03185 [Bacteroidota bacterium]